MKDYVLKQETKKKKTKKVTSLWIRGASRRKRKTSFGHTEEKYYL